METDDSPARPALVSVESEGSAASNDGGSDALQADPSSINTSMTAPTTGSSSSLNTLSSSHSATTAGTASPCDPLAAATAVTTIPMPVHEHPLSPDISHATTAARTSYFRSNILTGVSPVSNVIFPNEDEDDTHDALDLHDVQKRGDAQSATVLNTVTLATSPSTLDKTPSASSIALPTILRLPQPPHRLSTEVVDQRLREVSSSDLRGVGLAQELSSQLEAARTELRELKTLQLAREEGLIALLRETGSVTESLISRTLVRAKAEAAEKVKTEEAPDTHGWKITLGGSSGIPQQTRRKGSPVKRPPLAEDLEDAMFENDFKETARSISPTLPMDMKGSPQISHISNSPAAAISGASLHERRGRQSAQSLSARLFGGYTPPTSSYLSPTSDAFQPGMRPPLSASSGEGSPSQPVIAPQVKKSRANSIRSVTSASSHQSGRGLTSWAGSLWSWNKQDRTHYFSDDDEEDEEGHASGDESTPIAAESFEKARAKAKATQRNDNNQTIKGRPRTLSKSSSNSASTKSYETTAATSFSSHGQAQVTPDQSYEDDQSGKLRKSPSATSTLTVEDPDRSERLSPTRKEGPVRTLLGRRPSALHPDAALSTQSVSVPVTAASSPRTSLSGATQPLPTSTSILQSLHTQSRRARVDVSSRSLPSHFRAVSESASTVGKASGKLVREDIFQAPSKVSGNISVWTQRLLYSFQSPSNTPVPSILATASTPTSADMSRKSSTSPSTSRSMSPRLSQAKSKATLSPATVLDGTIPKTVRLSISSPSSQDATSGTSVPSSATEAVPLAPSEVHKQKGYIASAKGTIGRALGFSSTSSATEGSTVEPSSSKNMRKKRSNSLKAVIEPALTVPVTFTSFATTSSGLATSVPASATMANHQSHRQQVTTPLEMGTIIAPEAKPPTLSSDLADQMKDGPLVDRFGFVYDVKVGMKLLKEYRKKQEIGEERVISLDPPTEINVDDLREAIGPSPSATPGLETALNSAALHLADEKLTGSTEDLQHPAKTSSHNPDSKGEDAASAAHLPSNQSIRRLLNQLGEMNESVEQTQKEAWDAFIRRRKKKASRPPRDDDAAAAAKARKKRMTVTEAPLSTATGHLDDDPADNQFSDNLVGVASMGADKQDDKTFRHLVRSGIPIAYRPAIWAEVSGASEIREPGVYQELLARHAGESSPCLEQIDMDTHRTFPTNVFFAGSGPGVAKLRRVLIAYSWRDPSIGYCQGMNLLAALLLLVYPDEEDAFWMLASVLERTLPSDYYSSQLLVSQADQRVLQDLIQLALPDLYNHLEDLGVDLPAITFGWFLSLFTDALPIQTLLRVWDVLLVYGPISLFKVAIAIFKIHSAEIFATDSASNFYVLLTNLTSHLYSADKLLKTAFEDLRFIKRHDVESRRLIHVADIEQELAPRQLTPVPLSSPSPAPSQAVVADGAAV